MRLELALSCIVFGVAFASPAAAGPIGGVSVTAAALYGIDTTGGDPGVNGFGPGLAAGAGLTLLGSLYVGVALEHFFGLEQHESLLLAAPNIDIQRKASLTELSARVGYDWSIGGVVLRPNLGAGYALFDVETHDFMDGVGTFSSGTSRSAFVLSPAAEARIPVAGIVSACVELRYELVLPSGADNLNAFVIGVGVGVDL